MTRLAVPPEFEPPIKHPDLRARLERLLAPHHGTCLRCTRPWKFAKYHLTPYEDSRSCFPLCEGCWFRLGTPEARLPYYYELVAIWMDQSPGRAQVYRQNWQTIREAVLKGL